MKKLTHWLYSWTIFPCFNSSWKYSSDIVGKPRHPAPNTRLCKCETNFDVHCTKVKFFIKSFFGICHQIGRPFLYPLKTSKILKKSIKKNLIFWVVLEAFLHLQNARSDSQILEIFVKKTWLIPHLWESNALIRILKIKKMVENRAKRFSHLLISVVTSFTSLCFQIFSIVFPKTDLFIGLKKSFSRSFFDCFSWLGIHINIWLF